MNRDQLEELASLHALGLLEGEERRAFEQELATNPAAQELVAELNSAATSLALTAEQVTPPAALRERVLAALPERRSAPRISAPSAAPAPSKVNPGDKIVPFRWLPWAVAACFAIAAGLLFVRNSALESDRDSIRSELAAIIVERAGLQERVAVLEQSRIVDRLQIASLQTQGNTTPNAAAVVAWDPRTQQGLLKVANLPPLPGNRDYQLWVIDPKTQAEPIASDVIAVTPDGQGQVLFTPRQPVTDVTAFAISDAPKGGEAKVTGTVLMVGESK